MRDDFNIKLKNLQRTTPSAASKVDSASPVGLPEKVATRLFDGKQVRWDDRHFWLEVLKAAFSIRENLTFNDFLSLFAQGTTETIQNLLKTKIDESALRRFNEKRDDALADDHLGPITKINQSSQI